MQLLPRTNGATFTIIASLVVGWIVISIMLTPVVKGLLR